jgi:acyl-CoA thioester hydrolase
MVPDDNPGPIFFFAPFVSSTVRVEKQWIDYNGHLNLAYYHVLFDRALDEAFGLAGLGPDYVDEMNASYFAAETHTLYKRELTLDDPVRTTVQLIDVDEKRMHIYLEVRHANEGWISASCEMLSLHVDMDTRKVSPFPAGIKRNLDIMLAAHSRLPRPALIGRSIGIPNRENATEAEPAHGTCH